MKKKSQSLGVIFWAFIPVTFLPTLCALDADANDRLAVSDCGRRVLERSGEDLIIRSADGLVRSVVHPEALKAAPPLARPSGPDGRSGIGDSLQGLRAMSLVQIAELNGSRDILAGQAPIDLDRDGRYELILTENDSWAENLWIYESTGDDTFSLVHTIYIGGSSSIYPTEVADGDADGLLEILIFGRTSNDFWVRTYEQDALLEYPSGYSFELVPYSNWWASHAEIDDLDGDGSHEISYSMQSHTGYFSVHENVSDDSYTEVYSTSLGLGSAGIQRYTAGLDLDEDGKEEILMGGIPMVYLFENDGDDEYTRIWEYAAGPNVERLIDTGDIDRDGRSDFLLVGFPTLPSTGCDFSLYEKVDGGVLDFEVVWSHFEGTGIWGDCEAAVGDLDADGRGEIVAQVVDSNFNRVTVFEAIGDDVLRSVWSRETTKPSSEGLYPALAVADLDKDGLGELIFSDYTEESGSVQTLVFEAEPTSCFISAVHF